MTVRIGVRMQDYKSLHAAAVICATVVHTHKHVCRLGRKNILHSEP